MNKLKTNCRFICNNIESKKNIDNLFRFSIAMVLTTSISICFLTEVLTVINVTQNRWRRFIWIGCKSVTSLSELN